MEEKQNDEIFELYGKFLVHFEHVSHVMRTTIACIIFPNSSTKQIRQNEILLESLTADQVRNKLMALITEEYEQSTTELKLTKTISNVYERMIPIRNSFAHGTSFIGTSALMKDAQDGLLLLRHPKLRKTGLDLNFKRFEVDALKLGIQLFDRLKYAVAVIAVSVLNKYNGKLYTDGYSPNEHHNGISSELLRLEKKLLTLLDK